MFTFSPPSCISIHAPREGSDHSSSERCFAIKLFLSTLPARGATQYVARYIVKKQFLSTLPARGATRATGTVQRVDPDFYPRSPRGERHRKTGKGQASVYISIHAPREGSDHFAEVCEHGMVISIHAPREGSDATGNNSLGAFLGFLSTLPARGATRADTPGTPS